MAVFGFGQTLPRFRKPHHLDVADIAKLAGDEQAVFTTLQDIVNRRRPLFTGSIPSGYPS